MKTAERTGAPALGNALGYFAAFYVIDKYEWLSSVNTEIAVAMMGTIFIHILIELRGVASWVAQRLAEKQ